MIPHRTNMLYFGCLGAVLLIIASSGFVKSQTEKDFEFEDKDVIIKKRSTNSLTDDEDLLLNDEGGSGEGSGVNPDVTLPTAEYPEFFRVSINFTDLVYTDQLGNRNSKEFKDLANQVAAAIESLFAKVAGQQQVVVVQFSSGSVLVTFDLGTQGFYDRNVLYDTLNGAINQGSISPYRVSPEGFEFKPLQDGMTCPDSVGRDLSRLPRSGDNRANLLVNNLFPCRGYVIAWQYYRIIPRYTGYVGVWRQVDDYKFILVGKTELPVAGEGNITVFANPPILAEKGDFVGIFYPKDAEEGVVASATDTTPGILQRELFQNYYSRFYDEDVTVGKTFDLESVQFEETQTTFAVKAIMDYTTISDRTDVGCKPEEFQCNDKTCIEKIYRCDGQDDCYDASDEQNCPPVTCSADEFRCADNRHCVPNVFVCNQQPDCVDGSDERNCSTQACTIQQFRCNDNTCIRNELLCNGQPDCPDRSDEIGCPSSCNVDQFRCDNGQCIDSKLACDGFPDCVDSSDEATETCRVGPGACPEGGYRCADNSCVKETARCDGVVDCPDKSDEDPVLCGYPTTPAPCGTDEWRCDNGQCIPLDLKCDAYPDCDDRSDESPSNCRTAPSACPEGLYRCEDNSCVSGAACDGRVDCPDSSDESPNKCGFSVTLSIQNNQLVLNEGENAVFDCVASGNIAVDLSWRRGSGRLPDKVQTQNGRLIIPAITVADVDDYICYTETIPGVQEVKGDLIVIPACPVNQFRCADGSCIQKNFLCDGFPDCTDRSDEVNCTTTIVGCPEGQYKCDDGTCTRSGAGCDGRVDCGDGSDEYPSKCGCPRAGEFMCASGRLCISGSNECDGQYQCPDRSDEHANCTFTCAPNEFTCDNGACISASRRCDGFTDCTDQSDEKTEMCSCRSDQFECASGQCIDIRRRCDRTRDCFDNSDEQGCPCRSGEFTCGDGTCLPDSVKCNNVRECEDNSDEDPVLCSCRSDQFECGDGQCIDARRRCDRVQDCRDNSDERGCACRSDEFTCGDGTCLPASVKCNGRRECEDNSDEDPSICVRPVVISAVPPSLTLREGREARFQCSASQAGVRIRWTRRGRELPPKSSVENNILTIPEVRMEDAGDYVCDTVSAPSTGSSTVSLRVQSVGPVVPPTTPPPVGPCKAGEAVCSDGIQCIPADYRCDGDLDCRDGSDENCANLEQCEPNEFRCGNGRCVMKFWRCDGDNDCGDNTDEQNCAVRRPGDPCNTDEFQCTTRDQCVPASYHCDNEIDCQDRSDEIGCAPPIVNVAPPPSIEVELGGIFTIICEAVGTPTPLIVWRLNWGNIPTGDRVHTSSINGRGNLTIEDARLTDSGAYTCEAINVKGSIFASPDAIIIVRRSQPGICSPPFFNTEASISSECIRCFCFGHTDQCFSSDLQISRINLIGEMKMVNVNNTVAIDSRYIERLPSGPYSGFYQVGDGLRLVRPGIYYWSLPREFLGDRLTSYGGELKYDIYYALGRGPSQIIDQPDVIISGNGITLYHRTTTLTRPEGRFTVTAPLVPSAWLKSDGPRRGDTPVVDYATREDLMMVLENLDYIYIRSQYDQDMTLTRIGNVVFTTGVRENTGLGRAVFVEDCQCPPGYTGRSCQDCASGYRRFRQGSYLGICTRCNCNGHSTDCDPTTSQCRFCQHNTEGSQCERCKPGYYGDATQGTADACKPCPCPLTLPPNQFSPTCILDRDGQPTCNACPRGYEGRRCERCAVGFKGDPTKPGDYCTQLIDYCDSRGSLDQRPDPLTQRCTCKTNVQGRTCDTCKPNTFHLALNNPYGCIRCFCMGVTDTCLSTSWNRAQISASFTRDRQDFTLTDILMREVISSGFTINSNVRELIYRNFNSQTEYFWNLPSRFLGDKVMSYGGSLSFILTYRPGLDASRSSLNAPLVEIKGNDITLMYRPQQSPAANTPVPYTIKFYESEWVRMNGQPASREFLMMALADLDSIKIRATFTADTDQASIRDVTMDIAEERITGRDRAFAVEQCQCPVGYKGLSCEDCDVGYKRTQGGLYLGLCEPCQCNGHSSECDPETGACRNCQHNTEGNNCERCSAGFYGDATRRTPSDCQPCPCPLTQAPNQFSPTCILDTDRQVTCTACPAGHTGRRCESCIQGYTGNPLQPGDYCKIDSGIDCPSCDNRGTIPNTQCDPVTRQCQCKAHVRGLRCNNCATGYYNLDSQNPQGCLECYCSGVTDQCSSSAYYWDRILPNLSAQDTHNFVLTNRRLSNEISDGFTVDAGRNSITFNSFADVQRERESLFIRLPPKFRGNKVTSYGGYLKFTIETNVALDSGSTFRDVDFEIVTSGQRQRMYYLFNPPLRPFQSQTYNIHLVESSFRSLDGSTPTRKTFMDVLSDIEAILIRATYHTIMGSTTLTDLHMDTAIATPTGYGRATSVESCQCPAGYTGLSCEQCATGFVRQDTGSGTSQCVRCNCNGHASSCDVTTGECLNCQHNTVGDRCERCADGYYGDATAGTPNDCRACPCPLTLPSNQFSRTCHLDNDGDVTCDRCPPGYLGRDCGQCDTANGYTGNPKQVGGTCTRDTAVLRPRITVNPVRVEETVGQTISIQCNVGGYGPFNVVWSRENRRQLPSRAQVSPSYTLTIRNLVKTDEGRYVCTATNVHGSTRETVTVVVLGEKQPIRVRIEEPRNQMVDEGTSVRFVCVATGSLTQMTYILSWTRQGAPLPAKAIDNNGVLMIPNVQPEDQGNYICTGSDMMSTDTAVAVLTVSRSETAPTVRIEPRYKNVKEGELVEFRCIATGIPAPVISWRRGSGQMNPQATISNGVLRIPVALRSDESEYFCNATNVAGTSEVRTILYVTEGATRPDVTVIIRQTSIIAVIGGTAQLVCSVEDDSLRATLVWSKVGGLPIGATQNGGVLTLTNIQPSYAGRYVCTAITQDGDRGTGTATVTVQSNIVSTRPTVSVKPEKITLAQGTTGSIRCEVTGSPQPSIQWSKSRADLSPRHQVNGATLRITDVQMEDRGIYICRAENSAGIAQGWVVVEVERRAMPKLDLYPSSTQTINVGGSALFQCRVMGGDPPPRITWTRAGGEPLITATTEVMDNGVLMFKSVTGAESGSYVCTATNDMGSITVSASLIITGPPRIVITPRTTIYAVIGQRVEVECVGEGDPVPSVFWRYDQGPSRGDLPLVSTRETDPQIGSATLTIESATTSDTGNYVCVAKNPAGTTEENVQVIVQDSDRQPSRGSVVIKGPETVKAVDGQSLSLECETSGLRNPIVRWRRREGPLPPNHRIQGGTLYIPRFTSQYAGEYICSATTPRENFETSVFIIVTVTPTLTISPARVTARAGETVQLRCQPQGQGPFRIDWSRVDGRSMSRVAIERNDGLLEIRSVTPADAGRYRCVATNSAGTSDGIAIIEVEVPPTMVASSRDERPTLGSLLELKCVASGTPFPTITWEKERGALPSNSDIRDGTLTIYNVRAEDSGRYICTASSPTGVARDYVVVNVQDINGGNGDNGITRINTQTVNVGERVEMECVVKGTPSPTVRWSRLDGPLPSIATIDDVFLVIPQVRLEDAGTYVCTAANRVGVDEQRVNLFVRGRPIITGGSESMTAALGASATMACEATGYPQPEITWYKRNGQMPRDYNVDDGVLKIDRVYPDDAGTFVCSAQNELGEKEKAYNLNVGDLVPYFKQDPVSYISYPPLDDVYLNFDILLSMRPETNDGLVLYNGQYDDATGDYVCFGMRQGYPEFHFDVGSGPAVIRANKTLGLNQWHTVKLKRDRTQGTMEINDQAVYTGKSQGRFEGLDLRQNMYLGGVPDVQNIPAPARFSQGFVGSVSQVKVKGVDLNLGAEYLDMQGIEPFNACLDRPCMNRGICQAANTPYGYKCICTDGFTGPRCETSGQKCYPGACGPRGRCHDFTNGYQCICPMGRIGTGCQTSIHIVNPQFNRTSFVSYRPIRGARFMMKIELEFKPQTLDNGIIMYSGQSSGGTGDYFVILLRDEYLEFQYNTGSGPATLRSTQKLKADEWVKVTASKSGQEGTLIVNDQQPVKVRPWSYYNNLHKNYYNYYLRRRYRYKRGTSPGSTIGLDLKTPLYVGGIDPASSYPSRLNIRSGFIGCVAKITINMRPLNLLTDALETMNVRDCGEKDICRRRPCLNNGICESLSATDYRCVCTTAYTGKNCETELNMCLTQNPCQNNGVCSISSNGYKCDCPLGFMGQSCEAAVNLGTNIEVDRNGFVEFSPKLLAQNQEQEVIKFTIKTTSLDGLLLWRGQSSPGQPIQSGDYLSIGLQDGYVSYSYQLGSGPATMRSLRQVNDGYAHNITVTRLGRNGSLTIDDNVLDTVNGTAQGNLQILNTDGNLYLGGVPLVGSMTGGQYSDNYSGCISNIYLQNKGPLYIPDDTAGGFNVRPCLNRK